MEKKPTPRAVALLPVAVFLVLYLLVFFLIGRKKGANLETTGLKLPFTQILKSLLLAVLSFAGIYAVVYACSALSGTNFSFFKFNIMPMDGTHWVAFFKYLPVWLLFFLLCGVIYNSLTRINNAPAWLNYLLCAVVSCGGLAMMFAYDYGKLFATGVRVSELCSITCENLNLQNQVVLIKGKGSKERCIYISSPPVISALASYSALRTTIDSPDPYFFLNRDKHRLSEQSVRRIICRYTPTDAAHYTPHMFRHSFATYLWEQCGNIYEVKEILGHSSVKTTERYVHASFEQQKRILTTMHPRNTLKIEF